MIEFSENKNRERTALSLEFSSLLEKKSFNEINSFFDKKFSDELANDPELKSMVARWFDESIANSERTSVFAPGKLESKIASKFLNSDEILEIVTQRIGMVLAKGNGNGANEMKNVFGIPDSFFQSKELISVAEEGFLKTVSEGYYSYKGFLEIFPSFNDLIETDKMKKAAEDGYVDILKNGDPEDVQTLDAWAREFKLENDFLNSVEVQEATSNAAIRFIDENREDGLLLFSKEELKKAFAENKDRLKEIMIENLSEDGNVPLSIFINSMHSPPLDRLLTRVEELYGNKLEYKNYHIFKKIEEGALTDDIESLGVKHTGEIGINELRNILRDKRQQYLEGSFDPQELQD
ncbi:hypothetical protein KKC60_00685, partial [Patescibacteria group bacterium]|nr:hypothetical protein [Patescibacteria group bacterium]